MPKNDFEVFKYLSSDPNTLSQVDRLAFSFFFSEKEEWYNQYEKTHGNPPSHAEIERFIEDYTSQRLDRLKIDASTHFDIAARSYMEDEIESAMGAALESAILKEVKRAGNFWRQFGMAVITSILAPLVLAFVLFLANYIKIIPSPTDIASKMSPPAAQVKP